MIRNQPLIIRIVFLEPSKLLNAIGLNCKHLYMDNTSPDIGYPPPPTPALPTPTPTPTPPHPDPHPTPTPTHICTHTHTCYRPLEVSLHCTTAFPCFYLNYKFTPNNSSSSFASGDSYTVETKVNLALQRNSIHPNQYMLICPNPRVICPNHASLRTNMVHQQERVINNPSVSLS